MWPPEWPGIPSNRYKNFDASASEHPVSFPQQISVRLTSHSISYRKAMGTDTEAFLERELLRCNGEDPDAVEASAEDNSKMNAVTVGRDPRESRKD
jgi:hypothetical protein